MHPALSPVPDCALEDFDTFFFAPVGNGPFKMDGKWEDGQQINLVRFDDYSYGEKAKLDGIHFNIQKDVQTAYTEFQAGNLDVAQVPTTQLKDAISQYGESEDGYTPPRAREVLTGDELSIYYLMLNVNDEQLKDKDLRHALSLAINRQAICDTVFEGTREPAGAASSRPASRATSRTSGPTPTMTSTPPRRSWTRSTRPTPTASATSPLP